MDDVSMGGERKCLLCASADVRVKQAVTGRELRALWRALDREFSPQAWGGIGEDSVVEQFQCAGCGFRFFDPGLAGNEGFYRELERVGYYAPQRPEFGRTTEFARRQGLRRVLDIGCGSGFFLDLVRAAGGESYGLELNAAAAEQARAKGHRVFKRLLHELDPKETGVFDLITLFQVLEHVPEPVHLLKQAAGFLRPGGFLAVAVPAAEGVYRFCPWDPHQWPPHHVSLWRLRDFVVLGEASGLKLRQRGGDVLVGNALRDFWLLHNRLAPLAGQAKHFGGAAFPQIVCWLYRKLGVKHVFPHWGSSVYAYFQKG